MHSKKLTQILFACLFFLLFSLSGFTWADSNASAPDIIQYTISQGGSLPDLTGEWTSIYETCRTSRGVMRCKIKGRLSIQNIGGHNASTSTVRYYLSSDNLYDESDTYMKRVSTGSIKAGRSKSKTLSYSLPAGESAACRYIIAVIDADNVIEESNETNNSIIHQFEGCPEPDTTPPSVISVSPSGNATGVSVAASIMATFSEAMDCSTLNTATFTVSGVTGTVACSGATATFKPSGNLSFNTSHTATITTGARDTSGNALAADYVWSFTTGSTLPVTNLTNLFFLHHSTGEGLIVEGNMRGVIATYNTSYGTSFQFWDHGYNSDGLRDPSGNSTGTNYNIPDDNTDPEGLYNLWTNTESRYVTARNLILNNHQVIAFKSCFPASSIEDSTTLNQYIYWYLAMRDFFDTRPDRLFIVMSTPPLHRLATNSTAATNARAFADWLCSAAYLSGHSNVRCFNLFDNLANHNDGSSTTNMLRYAYEGSHSNSDSHPNTLANQTVGPIFADFLCNSASSY